MNPKVFVSHASEDKERFVLDFATKLRSKGIDAWVDRWEIYPGDSLIDKIFEEGIKNAQAIIIVISQYSICKAWVREELNASMVKKINGISKLIPVIIDDCEVPEALHSIVWEKIKDINNYDTELGRIVMSIYGHRDKPPIGQSPSYVQTTVETLPSLTKIDTLIMKLACEMALTGSNLYIAGWQLVERVKTFDISQEDFNESLEILDKRGYITIEREYGRDIPLFLITDDGFENYLKVYYPEYDTIVRAVKTQILNFEQNDNHEICAKIEQPQFIVDHVLVTLSTRGLINFGQFIGGKITIYSVSSELKRMMREE